ncbi:MAG: response regulator [Candidatus Zhuqueibacterota bacterium]
MLNANPILLVEDDQVDVLTVKRAIKELNIPNDLVTVQNGVEALNYLRGTKISRYCLVLLDLDMPKMTGLEFLQAIKADQTHQNVPVIVLTSSSSEQDKQDCFRLSVAGYFIKPVKYSDFVTLLQTVFDYWSKSQFPNSASDASFGTSRADTMTSADTCCQDT